MPTADNVSFKYCSTNKIMIKLLLKESVVRRVMNMIIGVEYRKLYIAPGDVAAPAQTDTAVTTIMTIPTITGTRKFCESCICAAL